MSVFKVSGVLSSTDLLLVIFDLLTSLILLTVKSFYSAILWNLLSGFGKRLTSSMISEVKMSPSRNSAMLSLSGRDSS